MSRGGYTGGSTSSYSGSGFTSSFSGSSWSGSSSSSSSSSSFSSSDYSSPPSSTYCGHGCRLGLAVSYSIFLLMAAGFLFCIYGAGPVIKFYRWVSRTCLRLWVRVVKGMARIKGCLLIPVWQWRMRNQSVKKKTVIGDGKVTELKPFHCGNMLAEENNDEKEISTGSNRTIVEKEPLWTCLCRFAARPFHLLRRIRPRQMREADIEKNEVAPLSTQSSLTARLRALKPCHPQIPPPMWPRPRSPHDSTRIRPEFIPMALSPNAAKKESTPFMEFGEKARGKEGPIGSYRTPTRPPSPWRRIYSLLSSSRLPLRLSSYDKYAERRFVKDPENLKKDVSSSSSTSTVVGFEGEKVFEIKAVESPKPVFERPLKCGSELEDSFIQPHGPCPDPSCSLPSLNEHNVHPRNS